MPSSSPKQHRFMEAIAHNPGFAKKAGVPQSVGREFAAADAGRPAGSPKSRDEHMARRAKHTTQAAAGKEFGTSQSTVSRKVMKQGYSKERM